MVELICYFLKQITYLSGVDLICLPVNSSLNDSRLFLCVWCFVLSCLGICCLRWVFFPSEGWGEGLWFFFCLVDWFDLGWVFWSGWGWVFVCEGFCLVFWLVGFYHQ